MKYSSAYISRSDIRLHFVLPEPLSILKSSGNLRRGLLLDGAAAAGVNSSNLQSEE